LVIFQRRPMFIATSMESSRRDLLNDMAEHRPILKDNQNMYDPRFGFTPKTGTVQHSLKRRFVSTVMAVA